MIAPARWFAGGFGLDSFRNEMLHDKSIRFIHDFPEASDCFSGVQIKGGVCYFLWDRDNQGDCTIVTHRGSNESKPETRPLLEKNCDTFIRYNEAVDILHKIQNVDEDKKTMDTIISSQKPFGLGTRYIGAVKPFNNSITVFGNTGKSYAKFDEIEKNRELIKQYKVFIPAAGSGSDTFPHPILGTPFVGDKGTACSETYIVIGPFSSKSECFNVISYIQTKLFRFLVMLRKPTQHALKKVYALVPMQDFSKPWTDAELYAKYNLTQEEIDFIESMIKPMNTDGERDE